MISSLPNYTVRALVNFLVRSGLKREQLLAHINTTDQALNSNEQSYPADDYEKLLSFGSQALNTANLGFAHGKAFELSFWGILGHIVAASPTLWDALAYQKRYQCLLGNTGQAYHQVDGDVVTMRWLSEPGSSENSIEQVITSWVAFAFSYTQTQDRPISVHFTHPPLADTEQYVEFFGCPVYFNADFNGMKISNSSLQLPVTAFNEEVLNVLCCHAEQKLALKRSSASLDVIRLYIIEVLPEHVPELPEIAEHLGMSSRQLQRNFQKHGTNLTALLEQIRMNLSVSYLTQTEHKLVYISSMLGYSEQSAFQRAFKTNVTITHECV